MFIFKLPDIGEGVAEGEIVKWNISEGDSIEPDQEMVEVMTDKVTVQIPSPVKGKIAEILVPEGKIARVGDIILKIDDGKSEETSNLAAEIPEETVEAPVVHEVKKSEQVSEKRILATPAVRKLAMDLGVDLALVTPSGPGGRILPDDIKNFKKGAPEKPPVPAEEPEEPKKEEKGPVPSAHDEIIEPKGLRRIIFEKMSKSKQIMPHFTVMESVDMTKIIEARDDLRSKKVTIGFTPFFVKAVAVILKDFPKFNSIYDEHGKRYILKKHYNIGFAVDTSSGLTVAVIKNADKKSIHGIADEIADLADRARKSELKLTEVQDSTFTVSNVGSIGGILSTPIINYPEVAILGVHRILDQLVTNAKNIMFISLSCDHRLIDGADAARFISKLKEILEKPSILLSEK